MISDQTPSMGATLNEVGADGWELVSVVMQDGDTRNTRSTRTFYYVKRQVQPPR